MPAIERILPAALILVTAVVAALPWGIGSELRFLPPHLAYFAIHYWTLREADAVSEWVVFAAGLVLDILTGGPIGFWPLVLLVGYGVALLQLPWAGQGRIVRWVLFVAAMSALAVLEWVLAQLYYLEWADATPYVSAVLGMSLAYPALAALPSLSKRHGAAEPVDKLGRRG